MISKYLAIIFQLFGSSIKIIQVAAWDEIHIFLTSVIKKTNIPKSIPWIFLLIWQMYMIILGYLEGYGLSIIFYRYILISLSIFFLYSYYTKLIKIQSLRIFTTIGFCYFIFHITFVLIGKYLGWKIAWWQDWLWAGTAYTAYITYVIVSIIFILNDNLKVRFLILFLAYYLAFLTDSRLTLILIFITNFFIFFGLRFKVGLISNIRELFKKIFYFIIAIILILSILGNQEKIKQQFRVLDKTFVDLISDNNDRDNDRIDNIKSVTYLYKDNIGQFIFGSGLTSHQYELLPYMNPSADGKVRPTGLPAVVFDGGIIYLIIILLCAISSIIKFFYFTLLKLIPTWKSVMWTTVIFNSFLILFVVNILDAMLWWAVILSGTILSKEKIINIKKDYLK